MMRRTAETGDFEASGYGYGGLRDTSVGVAAKNNDSHRETEEERRSENDNVEGTSGDDANATEHPRKRKRYNRHTPRQIQELEALFKECPHPDEKQRMELSKRLCLESRQVKFWFQNRRTQMKTQLERHQNALLRQEKEKLKLEKLAIIESMRSPICPNCGCAAALGDVSLEQKQLRLENARLRDGLDRVVALVERFLGRPMGSLAGQLPLYLPGDSSLDIGVGENGLPGRHSTLTTMAGYLVPSISSAMPVLPPPPVPPVTPVVTWDGLDVAGLEDGGVGCNPEY